MIFLYSDCAFSRPVFVFRPDADELRDVEEVAEGVGAVPEFVLTPEAVGDREEEKFVKVRGLEAYEAGRSAGEADPAAGKKSESVQAMPSSVSFRQAAASCSSSGQPHSGPVMTGW